MGRGRAGQVHYADPQPDEGPVTRLLLRRDSAPPPSSGSPGDAGANASIAVGEGVFGCRMLKRLLRLRASAAAAAWSRRMISSTRFQCSASCPASHASKSRRASAAMISNHVGGGGGPGGARGVPRYVKRALFPKPRGTFSGGS